MDVARLIAKIRVNLQAYNKGRRWLACLTRLHLGLEPYASAGALLQSVKARSRGLGTGTSRPCERPAASGSAKDGVSLNWPSSSLVRSSPGAAQPASATTGSGTHRQETRSAYSSADSPGLRSPRTPRQGSDAAHAPAAGKHLGSAGGTAHGGRGCRLLRGCRSWPQQVGAELSRRSASVRVR